MAEKVETNHREDGNLSCAACGLYERFWPLVPACPALEIQLAKEEDFLALQNKLDFDGMK